MRDPHVSLMYWLKPPIKFWRALFQGGGGGNAPMFSTPVGNPDVRHIWLLPTRSGSLNTTFPWWFSQCKRFKISIDSVWFYCISKNPSFWLDERHNRPHQTKTWLSLGQGFFQVLICFLSYFLVTLCCVT